MHPKNGCAICTRVRMMGKVIKLKLFILSQHMYKLIFFTIIKENSFSL